MTSSYTPWPTAGCTLAEARGRVTDCALWRELADIKRRLKNLGPALTILGSSLKEIRIDTEVRGRLQEELRECERKINEQFRALLRSGQLIACGRPKAIDVSPRRIPPELWPALNDIAWGASAAAQYGHTEQMTYYLIYVFPALLSPYRLTLMPRLLSDAVKQYVLGDPEVIAFAQQAVRDNEAFAAELDIESALTPLAESKWPLGLKGIELANFLARSLIGSIGSLGPDFSHSVSAMVEVIAHRFDVLRQMLVDRELIALGASDATGGLDPINSSQWLAGNLWVDVRNGDLLEQEKDSFVVRWARLHLNADPSLMSASGEGASEGGRRKRHLTRRPVGTIIAAVLKQHGLHQSPGDLTLKQVAEKIAPDVRSRTEAARNLKAIMKAIGRHYERLRPGG